MNETDKLAKVIWEKFKTSEMHSTWESLPNGCFAQKQCRGIARFIRAHYIPKKVSR